MLRRIALAAVWLLGTGAFFFGGAATGQGLLIHDHPHPPHWLPRPVPRIRPPHPVMDYRVEALEVDAHLTGQVAKVQVSQTFRNRSSQVQQVRFVFPLPYDGAIDQMTFLVDGEELEGRLLPESEAREIYQSYVRRNQDPALVRWIGTGMFQTQVFPIPAGAERTVTLRYTQLCRRQDRLTDWLLPLAPACISSGPVGKIEVRARLEADGPLGNIYSPSHDVEIERPRDDVATLHWKSTEKVSADDFRLLWDLAEHAVQASLICHRPEEDEDGYFMLLLQPDLPESEQSGGKNVILVLDKSGSMRGEKIAQTRSAARYVIDRLGDKDSFSLIAYDSEIQPWRNSLVRAKKDARSDAESFASALMAGGSTHIDEALQSAFGMAESADGPSYILFATDGRPTVGERNALKIANRAAEKNTAGARLFSLGIGHDVNSRLLDKLGEVCLGKTTYIPPGESIDKVVGRLYDRIGATALTDIELDIEPTGKKTGIFTRSVFPERLYDLFSGDQLVVLGRYTRGGDARVVLKGKADQEKSRFEYEVEFDKQTPRSRNAFVERLWASRRIGQIIDEIDLHGENEELVEELVELSKRHGILTPYTAFLAEEETDLNDRRRGRETASRLLEQLEQEAGAGAFYQRRYKQSLRSASRPADSDALEAELSDAQMALGGGGYGGRAAAAADGAAPAAGRALPTPAPGRAGAPQRAGEVRDRARAEQAEPRMRRIGSKSFFRRGERWVDADASAAALRDAETIQRLSDRYFELLARHPEDDELAQLLALDETVVFVYEGHAYEIVPPEDRD